MPMQAKAVGTVILVILTFITAWTIRGWKEGHDRADAVQAERDALMTQIADLQDLSRKAEATIRDYRNRQPTVTQIVKTIERPVYRVDCYDDDGMRALEAAANRVPGQSSGEVPDATPGPQGQDGR